METAINEFLQRFKEKINESDLQVIPTTKNRLELLQTGLLPHERTRIILSLTKENYSSGPEPDRDASGEVWVFGCRLERELIYIKLKLDNEAKCLSFHLAEYDMEFPYDL